MPDTIKDAMDYMDWVEANGDWLVRVLAHSYSADKAGEFQERRVKARETREQLRQMYVDRRADGE